MTTPTTTGLTQASPINRAKRGLIVIDLKLLRDDPERVRASQRTRGADDSLVDALLAADDARRAAVGARRRPAGRAEDAQPGGREGLRRRARRRCWAGPRSSRRGG